MALDKDDFLLAAFRKVWKIGKGLRSNGISNIAGFLQRNRFKRLGSVSLLTLYLREDLYLLVLFLDIQTFYQVLFAQVYSVRLIPIYLFLAIRSVL